MIHLHKGVPEKWPETASGKFSESFLPPIMQEGVMPFVDNIETKLYALQVDDEILPITVNEKEYQNAYSVSSYYVIHEWAKTLQQKNLFAKGWQLPLLGMTSGLFKWLKVNKVVIVNNCFFTTSIFPHLSMEQIEALTSFLTEHFPDHMIMFRSINTLLGDELYISLKESGYRMMPSRKIFAYDPKKLSAFNKKKQRKDLNLFKRLHYEVIEHEDLFDVDVERLVELYRMVYVDKYTSFAPHYTAKFVKHLLNNRILKFRALRKDGEIYGVMGQLQGDKQILTPFFGYDTSLSSEEGLYRMLSILAIEESNKTGFHSNYSSGAAQYKEWRGMELTQEYFALYDRHLPFHRQGFGFLSEKAMRLKR